MTHLSISGYNRQAAVAYAATWALGRNEAYADFTDMGGDCTNFVSQCLFAGTGVMNPVPVTGWYYYSLNDRSPSWTGVEFLRDFLLSNEGPGPQAVQVEKQAIRPGDVIQLGNAAGRFYHSLIVMKVTPQILVSAHTFDALNRPLDSYDYAAARYLHIK